MTSFITTPYPPVKPFPWVGKGICSICSTPIARGTRRCKNSGPCCVRALGKMKVIRPDDSKIESWYREAVAA